MRVELLAFYGGPDQIMAVTSGIATIVGVALMFWNKLIVTCGKILNLFRALVHGERAHERSQPARNSAPVSSSDSGPLENHTDNR
jgi:hypothetical protein